MSFYFRKLTSTLRLIPTTHQTPTFDYSTRVNERDKGCCHRESGPALSKPERTNPGPRDVSPTMVDEVAHSLLPVIITPALLRPVSHRGDVRQLLLEESVRSRRRACSLRRDSAADIIPTAVKPVSLTTDDILVHPFGGTCPPCGMDFIAGTSKSVSERVPVDILRPPSTLGRGVSVSQCDLRWSSTESLDRLCRAASEPPAGVESLSRVGGAVAGTDTIPSTHTMFFSTSGGGSGAPDSGQKKDGLTPEQMHNAKEKVQAEVESLFHGKLENSLHHSGIVLENNLFGKNSVSKGIVWYSLEVLKLRAYFHTRYSQITVNILNVTSLEQNGVIRVHWRLQGVPQARVLKFWQGLSKDKDLDWIEAFSYFHIGKDGMVHKHRIDRTLPDSEREPNVLTKKVQKLQDMLNPKPLVS